LRRRPEGPEAGILAASEEEMLERERSWETEG